MSVILCNTGQCGNQLGYCILDSLYEHLKVTESGCDDYMENFFRETSSKRNGGMQARAVCIDTEPKVVNECLWRSKMENKWSYDTANILYRHGGAGNNWAMGYQMCSGDFLDASLNCIRRELEFCDQPPLLLTVHSVAGGTGSGLGTHITESASDEFPDVSRMNIAITPYHFGEVVVQHYNSVLSLSKISASSHAVLVFENEVAQELCKKMRRIDRPTIADINHTIAANIVPMLLPKYHSGGDANGRITSHVHDDIVTLCSHPSYRFLDVKATPQTSDQSVEFTFDSWNSLLSTLERMHDRGTALEQRLSSTDSSSSIRSLASMLTLRGLDADDPSIQDLAPSPHFKAISTKNRFFVRTDRTALLGEQIYMYHSSHHINGYLRSASLVSNGQATLPILQRAASKAADLFRVGAYLHQYTSCGLEAEDFLTSFRSLGQVIEAYRSIP